MNPEIERGGLAEETEKFRKHLILETLRRVNGNQCKAAKLLKVHRNTVGRLLEQYQIPMNWKERL